MANGLQWSMAHPTLHPGTDDDVTIANEFARPNNARGAKRRGGAAEGGARVVVPIPAHPRGVWGAGGPQEGQLPQKVCYGLFRWPLTRLVLLTALPAGTQIPR